MSILIKGMEMPLYTTRNGEKDTIYQCAVVVHKDNTAELVVRRESAYPFANCNEAHIDKYQLIEIPTPHGRLIDADELFCKIDGIKGWDYGDESDMAISAAEALSAIDDSPTIIEAEVSENGCI